MTWRLRWESSNSPPLPKRRSTSTKLKASIIHLHTEWWICKAACWDCKPQFLLKFCQDYGECSIFLDLRVASCFLLSCKKLFWLASKVPFSRLRGPRSATSADDNERGGQLGVPQERCTQLHAELGRCLARTHAQGHRHRAYVQQRRGGQGARAQRVMVAGQAANEQEIGRATWAGICVYVCQ